MEMKVYKTMAYDKQNKKWDIIESEYPSKKNFIKDLRDNGYRVRENRIATKEIWDYVMENTNAEDKDFIEVAKMFRKNK